MATDRKTPPLTSRMERLLALGGPPFGRPRPSAEEMPALLAVLAEGAPAARRLNLARAIETAADVVPDARTATLIARILKDEQAGLGLRRQAAASLGEIALRASSKALTEALVHGDDALEATLLQALAKVGDAEAARAIAARPQPASARVAQLRGFARAAILLRAGEALDAAAARAVLPRGEVVEVVRQAAPEVEAALQRWRGTRYGVPLTPELGWRLNCGGADHLLLLSAALLRGKRRAWLESGPRLAGLVALKDEQDRGSYLARRVVMTQPGVRGIDVSVLRLDGEIELLGSLQPTSAGLVLSLRSIASTSAPVAVDGLLTEEAIEFEVRVFSSARVRKLLGDVDPVAA